MSEKRLEILVYPGSGNVGLVFVHWDCDSSPWLCVQPSLVSSAWQPFIRRPHSRVAMQSPWQLVPVCAVRRRGMGTACVQRVYAQNMHLSHFVTPCLWKSPVLLNCGANINSEKSLPHQPGIKTLIDWSPKNTSSISGLFILCSLSAAQHIIRLRTRISLDHVMCLQSHTLKAAQVYNQRFHPLLMESN